MNRQILFRGKTSKGEWVFGDLIQDMSIWYAILPTECQEISLDSCIDVIPETVGQYIGIDDKNGVKIFEGDIVQFEIKGLGSSKAKCYFSYGCFFLEVEGQDEPFHIFQYEFRTDIVIEVKGNIHDEK